MANLFRVQTNTDALRALLTLQSINDEIVKTQERLATGKTVNKASDDPGMYYISRLFETSISAIVSNQIEIERGIDFLETNNSRLDHVADVIIDLIDLVHTADSGAVSSAEQQAIAREIRLLLSEIDNVLQSGVAASIFTGISVNNLSNISISGGVMSTTTLSITNSDLIVTGNASQFATASTNLSTALKTILAAEETVGGWIHRLDFELDDLHSKEVADRAALSTIIDADLAEEQVHLSSLQILQQTSLVGLIQANSAPSAILGLISG
ncbi:MAG: hypothetical protein KKH94_07460 [Candidatus Omnitrophica bacterium]|nr:hypothetical protein [Candidatus Omnitrophota bacterium]